MSEIERLRTEVEQLRAAGLQQMESSDAERRESQRLHAAVVRFRTRVSDLERDVEILEAARDTEKEHAEMAEEAVIILKARVDELLGSLTDYGEHKRDCQKRSLSQKLIRRESSCTCGFEDLLSGGQKS